MTNALRHETGLPLVSREMLPLTQLAKKQGHKYEHGHVLVLSGGRWRTGAARLAARGALRIGAGLVTIGAPEEACDEIASQITALMLTPVSDVASLKTVLQDSRLSAIIVGPGFGTSARHADMLIDVLRAKKPTVLDADALTLLAGSSESFEALHAFCMLTPHDGEFRRMFPDLKLPRTPVGEGSDVIARQHSLENAVSRTGCCILLKGADTLISGPEAQTVLHSARGGRAAPWLATAGSGDVLAGFAGGLLARGMETSNAAALAAWIHTECAVSFGPGLIAEDLPDALPTVLRQLGL